MGRACYIDHPHRQRVPPSFAVVWQAPAVLYQTRIFVTKPTSGFAAVTEFCDLQTRKGEEHMPGLSRRDLMGGVAMGGILWSAEASGGETPEPSYGPAPAPLSEAELPSFRYPLGEKPAETFDGGTAKEANVTGFPVSDKLAGVYMTLEPGGLRELHWHALLREIREGRSGETEVPGQNLGRRMAEPIGDPLRARSIRPRSRIATGCSLKSPICSPAAACASSPSASFPSRRP